MMSENDDVCYFCFPKHLKLWGLVERGAALGRKNSKFHQLRAWWERRGVSIFRNSNERPKGLLFCDAGRLWAGSACLG